jgi:dTDP-4-dehydrorhamnose 3,5-epimerase
MVYALLANGTKTMYDELLIKEGKYLEDRGNIYTIYDKRKMPVDCEFVQDKISKSHQGVIRGFHGDDKTWKLINCLQGKIQLVTYNVDTDEKCVYILDADNPINRSVLVPPRTLNAHQCLSDVCIFHYKWSEYYTNPEDQWSVHYNDKDIAPQWHQNLHIIVSERDDNSQSLMELKKRVRK